jgi:hypothetical protein
MSATTDFTFFGPMQSTGTILDRMPPFPPSSTRAGQVRVGGFNTLVNSTQTYSCNISTPIGFGLVTVFSSFPGSTTALVNLGSVGFNYQLLVDATGKLTFQVVDAGGTSQIITPNSLLVGTSNLVTCLYRYQGVGGGNKSNYMELYLNGYYVSTGVGLDTPATTFLSSINPSSVVFNTTSGGRMQLAFFNNGGSTAITAMPAVPSMSNIKGSSINAQAVMFQNFSAAVMPTSVRATSSSSITGDPRFAGFEGEWYSVHGQAGHFYNLLSDDYIQINARFCEWPTSGAAMMTAMGVNLLDRWTGRVETVDVHASAGLMVNDGRHILPLDIRQARVRQASCQEVQQYMNREGFGTFLEAFSVETDSYVVYIVRATDHVNPLYVNVIIELKDELRRPHGIIGQTADFDGLPRVMEGSDDDYEVSSLRSSDFAFNKFLG